MRTVFALAVSSALLWTAASHAWLLEAPEEKGLAIATEFKNRDRGWNDMTVNMTMILRNSEQQQSTREIRLSSLELANDGDKSLSVFDKPRDVKGTAFLSFSHITDSDEQWLYLPALKRVKRIASRNKSGPFMGSEFSYEDMTSFEVEKYTYNYLRDEPCGAEQCFVVEQFPVDEHSGYSRRVAWIDHNEYRLHKIDFYDRKGALLKQLSLTDYEQYLGQYWRAEQMLMNNVQNKKSTDLVMNNYQFKLGLTASDFNKNTLKRAR